MKNQRKKPESNLQSTYPIPNASLCQCWILVWNIEVAFFNGNLILKQVFIYLLLFLLERLK